MKGKELVQDNSELSTCTALIQNEEDESVTNEKVSPTSPAVSRYGRTHKPKISEDFLPTDKKVGAILGLSPKGRSPLPRDASRTSFTSPNKAVEKGRLVYELFTEEKRTSTRGRKPKLKLNTSLQSNKKNGPDDNKQPSLKTPIEIKSEVSTSEKVKDSIQLKIKVEIEEAVDIATNRKTENEIMSPDVTSSVDDSILSESLLVQTPLQNSNDGNCVWVPGDLAWARVGGHPFWPCMVAIDPRTGVYTKVKRVGRGLTSVQRSLHVQFFGDNGRHSWVSTNCVIKFEGKDGLQSFADKVLSEIKKKDKKFSSAFVIRPSSKVQWDCAVQEAEEALSKTNQERIRFFEENFPPDMHSDESIKKELLSIEEGEGNKLSQSFKRKRNNDDLDVKPLKQVKVDSENSGIKIKEEKNNTNSDNVSTQRKQKPKKQLTKEPYGFRMFAEKYSKHASEIHPGLSEESLQKLMVRMWSAMDESEKAVYKKDRRDSSEDSSSVEEEKDYRNDIDRENDNDNDNSTSDSTRESTPSLTFVGGTLKKASGLFRGTRVEKVCQICLKPGNTVKCKGSCLGTFHVDCIKSFEVKQIKEVSNETDVKKKRRRPKSLKNENGISSESEDGNSNDKKTSVEECKTQKMKNYDENEKEASDKEESKHSSTEEYESGEFRCKDCSENRTPVCFECGVEKDPKTKSDVRIRCANGHCGKFYHLECIKTWPQASSIGSSKKQINGNKNGSTLENSKNQLTCPQHVCHTCASDDPRNATMRFNHERLVRCVQCPTAYHTGNYCIPAGSEILTGSQIICPRHYEPPVRGNHHVNAAWCFICAMGGSLICCDLCPTSFHAECLKIAPPEGGYICEDCDTGRYPLYGEVVWVKLGAYRWWPAQILFPNQVPDNIENLPHRRGEFAVRFFGSHDHYWVNRGRVFLYQEGDTGHKSAKKTSVDGLFQKALTEAAEAHKKIRVDRSLREAEARPGMKPPSYVRIKTNKPVGNVRVYEADPSSMTPCECDPESKNPCGVDSDCLNRILMVECTPGVCVAGDRCGNQRFLKREYPSLEPFRTESRGWGLRALKSLQKGDFVIEYVGEMIDEAEYKRRLDCKHEEKDENYYFLTIDNHRLLDAGPKGNVARFMNHSCQPNCETQKWTVNGDTRVGLFALQDIPMGEELTFNYNLECVGPDKKPCMCGAPNCSGYIGVKVSKIVEDDKKTKLGRQENQKSAKRKKKRQLTKLTETECFECGGGGELLLCDNKTCPKGYHLSCAKRKTWPKGKWLCPWHYCDVCQRRTGKRCGFCPRSFCLHHADGNIRLNSSLGMVCRKHDENTDKSQSEAYNAILEDVEICLKGISSVENKEAVQRDTLVTKSDGLFDKQENADNHRNSESNLKHNELPDKSEKSTQNDDVSSGLSESTIRPQTSVAAQNESSPLPINNDILVKKKRGRPRKYPLSPPTMARYMMANSLTSKELKTRDFSPKLESDNTIKKKRGRKRKNPLPENSVISPVLKSFPVAAPVTKDEKDDDKTPESVINLPQESLTGVTNSRASYVTTPRTSGRKRHPSEKLAALMNSQSKSAKKLCKTLDNFVIKLEREHETDSDKNEAGKAHKIEGLECSKKPSNLNKMSSITIDKKTVVKPNKTISNKLDKNHHSKSYKNSVMKSGKIFSKKLEKHNSAKSNKVQVTKPAKSSAKKLDKCYTSNTENIQTVKLHKHNINNLDKKNAIKTSKSYITPKIDEGDKPIFKSYQKKTPKKTILQRVDHKPEVSKFSVDNNQKLLTGNVTGSVFLSSRNALTAVASTSKRNVSSIVNNDESPSMYQKGEVNEMTDMSANSSILESFDDNDSQYFSENVTTIPIKFSEFDQMKDEFVLGSNSPSEELVETHTNLDSEFISCKEETTEKLSEDGKYQILTNMRPDSLDVEKQSSVLMGVES